MALCLLLVRSDKSGYQPTTYVWNRKPYWGFPWSLCFSFFLCNNYTISLLSNNDSTKCATFWRSVWVTRNTLPMRFMHIALQSSLEAHRLILFISATTLAEWSETPICRNCLVAQPRSHTHFVHEHNTKYNRSLFTLSQTEILCAVGTSISVCDHSPSHLKS